MPRLIIKQITLTNFKSYAGTKVLGPYDPHFTATVGPNGSGKSNTIDALLFVFGKRASKLRLKKVSELIHKSSDYPDISEASVTVDFVEVDDDGNVLPNTELKISRTAYKNNASKYFINGAGSSFTEVTALLREKGIDLDNNRFLILQGEVEQISQMRPKAQTPHEVGLLEYLEDIIGSNKYVESIEESGKTVDQLNETRNERLNRVKAVEKEKNNLEGSKAEAEKYLQKDQEVQIKRSTLYQLYRHESQQQVDQAEEKKQQFQEKLDYERNKLKTHEEELAEYEKEYDEKYKQYQEVEQQVKTAKKEFTEYERQDIKYREEIKECKNKVKKLESNYEKETSKEKSETQNAEQNEKKLPELEKEVETLQSQKEDCEKKLDEIYKNMRGKTESLRNELEEKQKEYEPFAERLNTVDSEINRKSNALKMTQDRIDTHNEEIEKYQKEKQETENKLKQSNEELEQKQEEYNQKKERLDCAQRDLKVSQKELNNTEKEMTTLRAEIEDAKASISDTSSQNNVTKQLMSEAKKGGQLENSGLAGRLGDLGTIDPKYDVAISTSCPGLSWLVTETTAGAEECVSFLRQKNLGRAKFVMMDKVQWLKDKVASRPRIPSGAQRLFDLIDVPQEYQLAFYFVMRDTLVAENLEQAVKIAYQGERPWKVVTLQGELIDANGTMSGGGGKTRSGLMNLHGSARAASASGGVSEKEVAKKEKKLKALTQQYEDTEKTVQSLKEDVSSLEAELPRLSKQIKRMQMDIDSFKNRLHDLDSQLASLRDKSAISKKEEKEMKENEKELKDLEKKRESVVNESEKLKKEIANLEDQITQAGGKELSEAKEELKTIDKSLEEKRGAITKAKVAIKTSSKNAKKAKEAAEQVQEDLGTEKKRLEELQNKFKEIENEALTVLQNMQNAEQLAKDRGQELQTVKDKFKKIESSIKSIRSAEVDITQAMEDCDTTINNAKKSISQFNGKLEQIQRNFNWNLQLLGQDTAQQKTHGDTEDQQDQEGTEETEEATVQSLPSVSQQDLESHTEDELKYAITILEAQRDELKNDVNMQAIQEYHLKEEEFKNRLSELEETSQERDEARKQYDALRKKRLDDFMAGFGTITLKLKEMYQMLTLGGDAELELVNSLDPFDGVVFTVRPPKKSWKNISNLSGGEKTLASLALVFALHHFKPTPLYVMDEIDAALDFKNVSIVANYLKERTKNAQFIIISLRNNMFELADRLVGIYKTNDATKSVTIDPHAFSGKDSTAKAGSNAGKEPRKALGEATNQVENSA